MEEQRVAVTDGDLRVQVWSGADHGTPRMLLHAAGESSETWDSLAREWSTCRTVYALDFSGHGKSYRSASYSLPQMQRDVLSVLDVLQLREVDIIGHSLGGMVGYLVAGERRPEVRRLVLEEAPPPLPIIPGRKVPDNPGADLGFDWQVIVDLYAQRNRPEPSWWQRLGRIEVPVLLIAGGETSHVDQAEMRLMAQQIPDCTMVTIDAGHNVHAAKTDEFRSAVDRFLAD